MKNSGKNEKQPTAFLHSA